MTIEEMKSRKRELGYTNKTIAQKTGLPLSTVQKIFSGATTSPRETTIRALKQLLRPSGPDRMSFHGNPSSYVSEPSFVYNVKEQENTAGKTGPYTLDDYLALPDEQRVELIDGYFYDMAAPATIHQSICGYIHKRLLDHVMAHKGPCYPFISPVDVQLDQDDKTVVQPDVMVVCNRDLYKNGRIFGAPDLIVEILSPSTRRKDMQLKMSKYSNAGVREYWMIDPEKKAVIQYDLEHLEFPVLYDFDAAVPVLIWDSKCLVDFREMSDLISFLWDT